MTAFPDCQMRLRSRAFTERSHSDFYTLADIPRLAHSRPLSGAKQTSNVRFLSPNRSCASECPRVGVKQTSFSADWMSACSQQRKSSVGLGMSVVGGQAEVNFGWLDVRS